MTAPNLLGSLSRQVGDAILAMMREDMPTRIARAYTTGLGDVNYDLQKPAKQVVPFLFPLSDLCPDVQGDGGTQTTFKVFTAVNSTNLEGWVPEGKRQAQISNTLAQTSVSYATLGLEDGVTWEAVGAGQGFEDVRNRMQTNLMLATLQVKENALAFANANQALGTPTTPTLATSTSGGTGLAASTAYYVRVIALTTHGYNASTVAGGVVQPTALTNPNGDTVNDGYGASAVSAAATITTGTGSTNSISATVPAVPGAVAYAWFLGTASGTTPLAAITTINSYVFTTTAAGTQNGATLTTDNSKSPGFDGMLSLAFQNGTVTTLATGTAGTGTGLTASGAATIKEIDTLLQTLWNTTRVSPRYALINAQELLNINYKIMANGGAPLFRYPTDPGQADDLVAGLRTVGSYLNPFTASGQQSVKFILHPFAAPGTITFFTDTIPAAIIPNNGTGKLFEFHVPSPMDAIHATEWPIFKREYDTGVYTRGALAHYFPKATGVITNIANA